VSTVRRPPYRFGFRLARIVRALNELAGPSIRRHGLRVEAVRVLLWLLDDDDQPVSDLSERTSLDPSTLSHTLRRLSRSGWISRRRVDSDNRHVIVSLTPAGRRVAEDITPDFKFFDAALVRGLSADDCDRLESLLDTVYENVLNGSRDPAEAP
jgi:DNA-binding MarR family transcriptional regulator